MLTKGEFTAPAGISATARGHLPSVGVVIVTFNSGKHIARAIAALQHDRTPEVHIVVVDNKSSDDSVAAATACGPAVTVIACEENAGFARACNLGAAMLVDDLILFLNPDTLLDPGALPRAVERIESEPDIGALGGRTRYPDGTVNPTCCFGRPTLWSAACQAAGLSSVFRRSGLLNPEQMGDWRRDDDRDVDAITGCFLLMRKELFDDLGGFDTRFFMYSEDIDLGIRIRGRGLRCVHAADVGLMHVGGASDNIKAEKLAKVFRARIQYYRKHWSPVASWCGAHLLDIGVLARIAAMSPVPGGRAQLWREIWRLRSWWTTRLP